MNMRACLNRGVSLLAAAALLCGLSAPAFALTAGESARDVSQPSSVVGAAYSENENAYEIYPVPHSVVYPQGASAFTMTDTVNVVAGDGVDTYTTAFLEEILTRFGFTMSVTGTVNDSQTNIVLAIHGDNDPVSPNTVTDLFTAQDKYDPYILTADASENANGIITIVGKDADCVYYGVATLQMMFTSFNGEKFLPVQIEDYSNTIFRGFIEGFYGGFDYTGRESQIRSIRDVKGNMYVFASKTDPYHGNNWNVLYPDDELNQIKHLVDVGKAMKVNYTWSVHIGKGHALDGIDNNGVIDETLYAQRLSQMKDKFQQLYDIGVRSFNVLNDDYNSGTYQVQVKLLNDINAWLKEKGDCMPLIYCCAGYNTSWAQSGSGGNGTELPALRALDDDIYLYWTGANVNSPITQQSVDYPNTQSGQQVVTWLNYPCSEHAKSGLFLGDISHYVSDADGLTGQTGILSNPINSPEANKVAYFQLLSWAWNRDHYTDYLTELWEDSFKYLQPEVYDSYLTIARNVSNCPGSSRVPAGFPESEYLAEALEAVQQALLNGDRLADIQGAQELLDEFDHILSAIADFRANCDNAALVTELEPWLKSLSSVVTAGKNAMLAADALADNDLEEAWGCFSTASLEFGQWDANQSSNPNYDADVMAKAGSRRLKPFAEALIDYAREELTSQLNPGGSLGGEPTFYAVMGGNQQNANAQSDKVFDGDPNTYGHFAINQMKDDYYGVDLGQVKLVSAVDILQGTGTGTTDHDYYHNGALECSVDGENWITLVSNVNSHHIHVETLSVAARYVRLRLTKTGYGNKNDYWTDIREFTVTTAANDLQVYTNVDGLSGAAVSGDGGTYTLTFSGQTELAAGDYVGLCLPDISSVTSIALSAALPAGLTLQYSPNGILWTDGAPDQTVAARFVRLVNTSDGPITAALPTVTVVEVAQLALSFVSTNTSIYQNNAWTNTVDGDRSTRVWTNSGQSVGQYAIYDLGSVQAVHDVSLWLPETGNDIPHNMDISVGDSSDPNGTWTVIGQIQNNAGIEMSPPNRVFTCDGQGVQGRYLKLSVTAASSNWLSISELEVNKTVPQEEIAGAFSGASGTYQNAADGNLSTFYTPDDPAQAGYLQYLLPELTRPTAVTILQDPNSAGTAAVKVQTADGSWTELGTLSGGVGTFTPPADGILALRLEWAANAAPAISEIVLAEAVSGVVGGTTPLLRPNIYEQPAEVEAVAVANGTALANIPLPETVPVTASYTSWDSAANAFVVHDSTVNVPVAWSCGEYDGSAAGTYTFTGVLDNMDGSLTNPGLFGLTAQVTVRPAPGQPAEENLAVNQPVYASGTENATTQPCTKAVDGSLDTQWNSNHMTSGSSPNKTDLGDAWIVVDLGEDVSDISEITIAFFNLIWPTDYKVQVAGSDFTPVDYSDNGTKAENNADVMAGTYTGQNAEDANCWTTIKAVSSASYLAHPTVTFDSSDFDTAIPNGTRYLRLYFTGLNHAAAGNSVGVKELTVTGTREISVDTNVASVDAVTATGTVGTAFTDLTLPTHVNAALADGTKIRLPVIWSDAGYDANSTAAQTITGTLVLDGANVTNTNGVSASLTLTLAAAPTVSSVQLTPDSLSVSYGTAFAELELPTQAIAVLSNGSIESGTIVWDENSYDATRSGVQTVTGTLTVNGLTHAVSITVTVSDAPQVYYTVTFQGDEIDTTTVLVEKDALLGDKLRGEPTREGYTFSGWYAGETQVTAETRITGNLTVIARWTEISTTPLPNVDPISPTAPTTTTETRTNEDGSVTTTVTDTITGAVTETTVATDGSKIEKAISASKDVSITVTDQDGEVLAEVKIPAEIPALSADEKFIDVPDGNYAAEAINSMAALGVMNGKGNQIFDRKSPMTRSELAKTLYALANGKEGYTASFVDVPSDKWYADCVAWAAKVGVVTGVSDTEFEPDRAITREELAAMLRRYAKLLGMDTAAEPTGLNAFSDGAATHAWAAADVAWCVEQGILQGRDNGMLDPRASASRQEVAVMLQRFVELLGK